MIRRFFGSTAQEEETQTGINLLDYNPLVWFDAQDSGTVTLTDNKVSGWTDKANGNNLFQTNETLRPLYTTSPIANNFPAIQVQEISGVGLELTTSITITEIIMVTSYKTGIEASSSPIYTTPISGGGSNGVPRIMVYSNTDALYGSGTMTSTVYKNGDNTGSNILLPLPLTVCNFRLGTTYTARWYLLKNSATADRNFRGFTGEILMFGTALSDTDRTDIVNHLMTKWGI